jgi:hypothetical protein
MGKLKLEWPESYDDLHLKSEGVIFKPMDMANSDLKAGHIIDYNLITYCHMLCFLCSVSFYPVVLIYLTFCCFS